MRLVRLALALFAPLACAREEPGATGSSLPESVEPEDGPVGPSWVGEALPAPHDGDCAEPVTIYQDLDGDGYGDAAVVAEGCPAEGWALVPGDCDDGDAERYPSAPELCDTKDNDCDGERDEGLFLYSHHLDKDSDGYGDAGGPARLSCDPWSLKGEAPNGRDCNDLDLRVRPGVAETCNLVDEDCDGEIDEGFEVGPMYYDGDGDGFGDPLREKWGCLDAPGHVPDGTDCDSDDPWVSPAGLEICDGDDNDCDGSTDEGFPRVRYYADEDGDDYGDPDAPQMLCDPVVAYSDQVKDATDCAPYDRTISPAAREVCENGRDDDCDGLLDCEDEACEDAASCLERACADGLDDDGDGAVDCEDDECWGDGACPTVVASQIKRVRHEDFDRHTSFLIVRSSCVEGSPSTRYGRDCTTWVASEVAGTVRIIEPGGGDLRCSWGLDQMWQERCQTQWRGSDGVTETWTTSTGQRVGFWLSEGCPLENSDFLPDLSALPERWRSFYDAGEPDGGGHGTWYGYCPREKDHRYHSYWSSTWVGPGARFTRTSGTYALP